MKQNVRDSLYGFGTCISVVILLTALQAVFEPEAFRTTTVSAKIVAIGLLGAIGTALYAWCDQVFPIKAHQYAIRVFGACTFLLISFQWFFPKLYLYAKLKFLWIGFGIGAILVVLATGIWEMRKNKCITKSS